VRQPNVTTSHVFRGKKMIALAEEPALMMPIAVPRERSNQRLTIAAAGIWIHAMPAAPSTPNAR
jgi:hypothetical protein